MRMFASRTIISAFYHPAVFTRFLEFCDDFFHILIRKLGGEAVGGGFQVCELCRSFARTGPRDWSVNSYCLAVAGDGDGRIRFEEGGEILAKLANTYFDGGHEKLLGDSAHIRVHKYKSAGSKSAKMREGIRTSFHRCNKGRALGF